jgi:hypothetical protein
VLLLAETIKDEKDLNYKFKDQEKTAEEEKKQYKPIK